MNNSSSTTRREFLKTTLGLAALSSLSACDTTNDHDSDLLFTARTIDENDFIDYNSRYYSVAIDENSQLPLSFIREGVAVQESDPVSIAFRLQYLLADLRNEELISTLLDTLLAAQIDQRPPNNFRNMIPRLAFSPNGIVPATREYSFLDNALLSSRVAMVAQAFSGMTVGDKAFQYLEKQRLYYNQVLFQSPSGLLPEFGDSILVSVDPLGLSPVFCGYYDGIAFVLGYLIGDSPIIGDPQVGLDVWQTMIDLQNTFVNEHEASTRSQTTINTPLARNGSGFQYFHSLLGIDPSWLSDSMYHGLYNVLFSYLDAAAYDRVPGCYSAGPHSSGFFFDNGLNRLATKQRFQASREVIVTTDALGPALRLFSEDSDERLILRGWMGQYASTEGIITEDGYCGGMDKEGQPVTALYGRQNGAMILFKSNASRYLNDFMKVQGRTSLQEMIGMVELYYEEAPIQRLDEQLPVPIRDERLFSSR